MYHRIPLSIEARKVLRLLMYTLLGLLFTTSAYFFVAMSNTAESGYAVQENQLKQKNLELENHFLKQRLLDAQSLSELKNSKVVEGMIEPDTKIYVAPKSPLSRRK